MPSHYDDSYNWFLSKPTYDSDEERSKEAAD